MATETTLVNAIRKAMLDTYPGAYVLKVHGGGYQTVGVPDLILCVEGRFIGLEVKRPRAGETIDHARGRATPGQLAQIREIWKAGGYASIVVSVEEALTAVGMALAISDDLL